MIQFHKRCIGSLPAEDSFDEFICKGCVVENAFFKYYQNNTMFNFVAAGDEIKPEEQSVADAPADVDGDQTREPAEKRARLETDVEERSSTCKIENSGLFLFFHGI